MHCLSQHIYLFFGDQPMPGDVAAHDPCSSGRPLPSTLFRDTKPMSVGSQHFGSLPGWPHARPRRFGA